MTDGAKTTINLTGTQLTSLASVGQTVPFLWASGPFSGGDVACTGTQATILSDTTAQVVADCTNGAHAHFTATADLCNAAKTTCTNALAMSCM
jgi:hypothetical protein